MPLVYTNRKEDVYYLHQATTKKGNPRYYFSKSQKGELLDEVPDGYEIYENPNVQVFLRKKEPQLITDSGIDAIRHSIEQYTDLTDYKIDVRKATLTIHLPNQNMDELKSLGLGFPKQAALQEFFRKNQTYTAMMRFRLLDQAERIFVVERYYSRGEEGWMEIGSGDNLQILAELYCRHLVKNSFFELY